MNANLGAQAHLVHHGRPGIGWKLWLAGAGIVILTGFGLDCAISNWLRGEIELGLLLFGCLVGVAVAYAFGYFWCLPDVLGGISSNQSRTLHRRWLGFALLTAFVGLLTINISYIRVIWVDFSYIVLGEALAILVGYTWLLSACVVGAENYLGWTMPHSATTHETGWRARARRAMGRFGNWLVTLVGSKRALGIGGGFALLSLMLMVHSDVFGPEYKGYEIVAGTGGWWHATVTVPSAEIFLTQVCRVIYVLGLGVAAFAFVGVMGGRLARMIRGSRLLATLAGVIALFEVTDVGIILVHDQPHYLLGLWILIWVAPIVIWLGFARGGEDRRNHTRLAVMVYYLPIFLLAFAFLPFYTYLGLGFGAFVVGMLLVWWGLVPSQWEVGQKQNPHPL